METINTSFLNETDYVQEIKGIINTTLTTNNKHFSKRQSWDLCKVRIKEFSITYGKLRSQKEKEQENTN